jgi:hypothetical protein
MNNVIKSLLRDLKSLDESYHDRLQKFATSEMRKNFISINVKDMEAQVDPKKVGDPAVLERIEINI